MKRLVLAEKPSVGRDIARVLGCKKETHSYIEGNDHIVTWALGHLVSLADPEQYGKEYKEWNMDVLPMMPKHWKLTVLKKTSKQFQTVKKLLLRNDIKDVIIATDAGREGELVARWILQMSGNKKPIYRLWISSVTDKAIKDGFAHLKPGKEYDDLFRAARSRAEADWLVGINATRALTCKYNAQLSCGRVQTPTLAMIMNREQEIKSFKPQKYYGYKIFATGMNFTWENQKGNQRISAPHESRPGKHDFPESPRSNPQHVPLPRPIRRRPGDRRKNGNRCRKTPTADPRIAGKHRRTRLCRI